MVFKMKQKHKGYRLTAFITVLLLLSGQTAVQAAEEEKFRYGEASSIAYVEDGTMPSYMRSLPISEDDPNKDVVDEDALIHYQ